MASPAGDSRNRLAVVAIDGPGGSGKSVVARRVARRLGFAYLDTGAMYRALTYAVLEQRLDLEDTEAVGLLAQRIRLDVRTNPGHPAVLLDGRVLGQAIRTRAVTNAVSAVSAIPAVRKQLAAQQRGIVARLGLDPGIVVEGRDIGTVVAPDAPVKVFLTASTEARALRRSRQLGETDGRAVARTHAELTRRDLLDSSRARDPLRQAADAHVIESTTLGVDEVVELVIDLCRQARLAPDPRPARSPRPAERAPRRGPA